MPIPHTKPPITCGQMVALLEKRGLQAGDRQMAGEFLRRVNYYRFSAYCIPFQAQRDVFFPGTTFEQVVKLYNLDESLRMAVLRVLSPIEIYLRTKTVYELSHGWGPFAHYDPAIFRRDFDHVTWLAGITAEIQRSKETFIKHYRLKYDGYPRLPFWIVCEVMSLGSLSLLYSGLLPEPQRKVSAPFDVSHTVLVNWLHVITYIRNLCAHHSRPWNRELSIRPDIPRKKPEWTRLHLDNRRLYSFVQVTDWLLGKAGLMRQPMDDVHCTMTEIQAMDKRFGSMMGLPSESTNAKPR